jgi:hypothetical protein
MSLSDDCSPSSYEPEKESSITATDVLSPNLSQFQVIRQTTPSLGSLPT